MVMVKQGHNIYVFRILTLELNLRVFQSPED